VKPVMASKRLENGKYRQAVEELLLHRLYR
jgi:hypothetical protein